MASTHSSNKKETQLRKISGRFSKPEAAAKAKNADLIAHVKKIGLKIIKTDSSFK